MPVKQVRKVTMEFYDGTSKTVELPEDAGYLKESYTYAVKEPEKDVSGVRKWGGRVNTFTLYWAENEVAAPT